MIEINTELKITSKQDCVKWLDQHYYHEEIYIANLQPIPRLLDEQQYLPETVSFDVGHPTSIDWMAGNKTLFIFQRVIAKGITKWCCEDTDFEADPMYADRGLSLGSSDALEIIIDNNIRLKCAELDVSQPFEALIFNQPELTDTRVDIEIPNSIIPTPTTWVSWFESAGLRVAWRLHHDTARDHNEVPQIDYSGWFIQELDRVNDTSGGLMMTACTPTESGFATHMDFWKDQENPEKLLWISLAKLVAALPESEVYCGNCSLSGIEWYHCLEKGQSHLDKLFPQ